MIYELARPQDLTAIQKLLQACDLPSDDLDGSHLNHFILAKENGAVLGCIGLEMEGPLLRSLAVDPAYRGQGIARQLCDSLLQLATQSGAKEIYLLTTTAADFFDHAGFQRKNREEAPPSINRHRQFTELCPSSAVLMWKRLC